MRRPTTTSSSAPLRMARCSGSMPVSSLHAAPWGKAYMSAEMVRSGALKMTAACSGRSRQRSFPSFSRRDTHTDASSGFDAQMAVAASQSLRWTAR